MLVSSPNTRFTYRNKPIDTERIGRELGVRYVLEGDVQRSGNRVRVTAQLIDAETDAHLWAERFDGDTRDLLVLQDEITNRIAVALDLELVDAAAARLIERPDARDSFCAGAPGDCGRRRARAVRSRFCCSSAPWRSIQGPSQRRAGWRSSSPPVPLLF